MGTNQFAGVLVVLAAIVAALILLVYVIPRAIAAMDKRRGRADKEPRLDRVPHSAMNTQEKDLAIAGEASPSTPAKEIAAAIGLALELETGARQAARPRLVKGGVEGLSSPWVLLGRARQLRGLTP